jgi:hypothetical protein
MIKNPNIEMTQNGLYVSRKIKEKLSLTPAGSNNL